MFIAPPAAGKGTQAELVVEKYHIPHISTGDILREIAKEDSEIGQYVYETLASGKLVKDEITYQLIEERLSRDDCKNGYILDGYPRNVSQAEGLEAITGKLDKVLCFNVDDEVIVDRMTGRRGCPKCGQMFHIKYNPPKIADVCDVCGAQLVRRPDDDPAVVASRLDVYHEQTEPLIGFYTERGLLKRVDGEKSLDEVAQAVRAALGL